MKKQGQYTGEKKKKGGSQSRLECLLKKIHVCSFTLIIMFMIITETEVGLINYYVCVILKNE